MVQMPGDDTEREKFPPQHPNPNLVTGDLSGSKGSSADLSTKRPGDAGSSGSGGAPADAGSVSPTRGGARKTEDWRPPDAHEGGEGGEGPLDLGKPAPTSVDGRKADLVEARVTASAASVDTGPGGKGYQFQGNDGQSFNSPVQFNREGATIINPETGQRSPVYVGEDGKYTTTAPSKNGGDGVSGQSGGEKSAAAAGDTPPQTAPQRASEAVPSQVEARGSDTPSQQVAKPVEARGQDTQPQQAAKPVEVSGQEAPLHPVAKAADAPVSSVAEKKSEVPEQKAEHVPQAQDGRTAGQVGSGGKSEDGVRPSEQSLTKAVTPKDAGRAEGGGIVAEPGKAAPEKVVDGKHPVKEVSVTPAPQGFGPNAADARTGKAGQGTAGGSDLAAGQGKKGEGDKGRGEGGVKEATVGLKPGEAKVEGKTLHIGDDKGGIPIELGDRKSRENLLGLLDRLHSGKLDGLDAKGRKILDGLKQMDADKRDGLRELLGQFGAEKGAKGRKADEGLIGKIKELIEKGKEGKSGEQDKTDKIISPKGAGEVLSQVLRSQSESFKGPESAQQKAADATVSGAARAVPAEARAGERTPATPEAGLTGKQDSRTQSQAQLDSSLASGAVETSEQEKARVRREAKEKEEKEEEEKLAEQEREAQNLLLANEMLAAQLLKEQQEQEERTRLEKEEQERLEREKKEQEERERQEDERRQQYKVKKGDTLESIAANAVRDAGLAPLLYEINKDTIPTKKQRGKKVLDLKPGLVIWLPSARDIRDFKGSPFSGTGSTFQYASEFGSPEEELAAALGGSAEDYKKESKQNTGTPASEIGTSDSVMKNLDSTLTAAASEKRSNIERELGPVVAKEEDSGRIKYVVRLGDTLKSIAIRHPALQDVRLWKLVAEANNLSTETDDKGVPIATLKRGLGILIPSPEEIEAYREKHKSDPARQPAPPKELATQTCPACDRVTVKRALICPGCGHEFSKQTRGTAFQLSSTSMDGVPAVRADKSGQETTDPAVSETLEQVPTHYGPSFFDETDAAMVVLQAAGLLGTDSSEVKAAPEVSGSPLVMPFEQMVPPPVVPAESSVVQPLTKPSPVSGDVGEPGFETAMEELSEAARLVRATGGSGTLDAGYKVRLEMRKESGWVPVIVYEVYEDVSLRHEFALDGKRRTVRIDLPPQAVRELADNDMSGNWQKYLQNFLAGRSLSD